jgi:hypothetical protein
VPPKVTSVVSLVPASVNPVPVIITGALPDNGPLLGLIPVTVGAGGSSACAIPGILMLKQNINKKVITCVTVILIFHHYPPVFFKTLFLPYQYLMDRVYLLLTITHHYSINRPGNKRFVYKDLQIYYLKISITLVFHLQNRPIMLMDMFKIIKTNLFIFTCVREQYIPRYIIWLLDLNRFSSMH